MAINKTKYHEVNSNANEEIKTEEKKINFSNQGNDNAPTDDQADQKVDVLGAIWNVIKTPLEIAAIGLGLVLAFGFGEAIGETKQRKKEQEQENDLDLDKIVEQNDSSSAEVEVETF